jgi:CHASE2 domain-containing sensor protein
VTTQQSPGARDGRAIAVYTGARLGLFVLCLGLAWVAGLDGAVLLVVALLASGVLSWFVLRRPRLAMSGAVDRRVSRAHNRVDARAAAEDAYVDSLQGTTPPDRSA